MSGLVGVDPAAGGVLWRHNFTPSITSTAATPIAAGDVVYASAAYGRGAWTARVRRSGSAFTVTDTHFRQNTSNQNHWASPILHEGFVYSIVERSLRSLGCYDPVGRTNAWTTSTVGSRNPGFASLIKAGGVLVVLTEGGELVLVDPSPVAYRELSRFQALSEHCWNHPAISNGRLYANDNDQRLPRPDTDNSNKNDTHTPILSNVTKTNLLRYSGELKSLDCPNLHQWMLRKNGWRVHDDYGVAIGYHYLGGHPNSPWPPLGTITNTWVSPQKADEDPNLVLVADLNVYCYSFPRILAPHTAYSQSIKDDAYFDEHSEAYSQTPADIGAQGGNVGKLDGSAAWKNFRDMRTYRSSFLWETDGAFGMW